MNALLQLDQYLTCLLNGSHSLYADHIAQIATRPLAWVFLAVALLYVIIRNNDLRGVLTIVIAIALCITLADQIASTLFKPWVARFRPTHEPALMYAIDIVDQYRGGTYGFFSSHAANSMAVATFLALLMRHRVLTVWLYTWALFNCWTRVYLGVHYVGDLQAGTLCGLLVGWGVYALWRRYARVRAVRADRVLHGVAHTSGGYSVTSLRLLMMAFVATYLFIALYALVR